MEATAQRSPELDPPKSPARADPDRRPPPGNTRRRTSQKTVRREGSTGGSEGSGGSEPDTCVRYTRPRSAPGAQSAAGVRQHTAAPEGGWWSSSSRASRTSCEPPSGRSSTRSAPSNWCAPSSRRARRPGSCGPPWSRSTGRRWPCPRRTMAWVSRSWRPPWWPRSSAGSSPRAPCCPPCPSSRRWCARSAPPSSDRGSSRWWRPEPSPGRWRSPTIPAAGRSTRSP